MKFLKPDAAISVKVGGRTMNFNSFNEVICVFLVRYLKFYFFQPDELSAAWGGLAEGGEA